MKFQVQGERIQAVTVEVDAESEEEAIGMAQDADYRDVDVWDSDTNWFFVQVVE